MEIVRKTNGKKQSEKFMSFSNSSTNPKLREKECFALRNEMARSSELTMFMPMGVFRYLAMGDDNGVVYYCIRVS